ncbi:MAG TPA: NlpC/P60 family protein [Actinomycetota bacterium]|nr:NlpC/P60 family protein [Actinomycetota bacterium]
MTSKGRRITRPVVAVVFVLPVLLSALSLTSLAAPSEEEVQAAREKLATLEHDFEVLAEQYNDAKYRLGLIERKLAEAKEQRDAAENRARVAEKRLAKRAVEAYLGTGSQVDGLLSAESMAEFSDRLEFMGAVAEGDAAIARDATNARQEADWAAERFAETRDERERQVRSIEGQLDRLDSMIAQQSALYEQLNADRQEYLAYVEAQRAALEQARREAAQEEAVDAPAETVSDSGGGGGGDGGGGFVPPANSSAAQVAVQAALSVLGTHYVWGSASPSGGFDCSGLTSWAWAQAGVYIPHSSAAQYSSLPHVPLGSVQPGDLIFYYSPISHVALYIGGGQIVHARNPGPGGEVQVSSMYGYSTPVGASRPG